MTTIDINDNDFKQFIGNDDPEAYLDACIFGQHPELEETAEFNLTVLAVAAEMVATLLEKNEKYRGAYRKVRQFCKERYGDPGIPYAVHSFEKQLRINAQDDDEDADFDNLGYHLLEIVCKRLDDQLTEPTKRVDPDSQTNGPSSGDSGHWHLNADGSWERVADYGAVLERSEVPEIPHVTDPPTIDLLVPIDDTEPTNGKVCIVCGKPLTGMQRLFCSKRCANRDRCIHGGIRR